MTDELSIQPQVIQRKDNSALYGTVGAVAGAGLGYGVNRWVQKPMSHEDIVADANKNDRAEFSSKYEKQEASWKEVTAKADEVKKLESDLEKITKGTLDANAAEQIEYNAAEKAKNDAYTRLFDAKKAELEGHSGTIDFKNFKKFDEIPATMLPTEDVRSGKPFKGNQLQQRYTNLTAEVTNAQNALDASLNSGLRRDKDVVIRAIDSNFNQAINDLTGKTPEQIAQYFAEKTEPTAWFNLSSKPKLSRQYSRAVQIADAYYPMPTDLTNEQYLQIGRELAPGEKAPTGFLPKSVQYKAENGRIQYKTIYFDQNEARNILNTEIERINGLRTATADQIFAETQKAVQIKTDINSLGKKIGESVPLDKAQATGLYIPAVASNPDSVNMTEIIRIGEASGGKGYSNDIQAIEKAIANAKKTGTTAVLPTGLNANFASGTKPEEALSQLRARNEIYKNYSKQLRQLNKELDACKAANPIIEEYNSKIANEISSNTRLAKAKEALEKQFPALFGGTEGSTLSADEIKTQAEKYATENSEYKNLLKKFEEKKAALDDAIAKNGKVDEAAKKSAEEALETAKKQLKEKAEALGKKMAKGGVNPVLASAIGAVALGAAVFGLSKSSN